MNEENYGSSQLVNGMAVFDPENPEREEMPWVGLSGNAPTSDYPAGGLEVEQALFANPLGVGEIWDGVRADMGSLMPTDEQQLAELANCWWIAKEEALPTSLVSSLLPAYQEKYSREVFGEEFQSPMRFFEKTGQLVREETYRRIVESMRERGNGYFLQDIFNQTLRSSTSEGPLPGAEGVTRLAANVAGDYATGNERLPTENLEENLKRMNRFQSSPSIGMDPGMEAYVATEVADITRVLENRQAGRDSSENRDAIRQTALAAERMLLGTADLTHEARRGIDAFTPVSDEFRQSFGGQYYAALAQMPTDLVAYRVPGLGPLLTAGKAYDSTYYDAIDHGASPKEAHHAAMLALPSATFEVLADKVVLGKVLKPFVGRIKVGDLMKTLLTTAATGGLTEGAQQFYTNFNAKYLSGYDPERQLDEEVLNSILIGMLVDTTTATGGQALLNRVTAADEIAVIRSSPTLRKLSDARKWLKAKLAGRPIQVPALGGTMVMSKTNAEKMTSASALKKSTSARAHLAAIEFIPQLGNVAIVESHSDRANDPNIGAIHRLYAPMEVDGKLHRVKMTVKEIRTDEDKRHLYSLEAVEIEVPAWSSTFAELVRGDDSNGSAPPPHAGFIKVSDLLGKSTNNGLEGRKVGKSDRAKSLSELYPEVEANAMVHFSSEDSGDSIGVQGVRPNEQGYSHWFRFGDIQAMSPEQIPSLIGNLANDNIQLMHIANSDVPKAHFVKFGDVPGTNPPVSDFETTVAVPVSTLRLRVKDQ